MGMGGKKRGKTTRERWAGVRRKAEKSRKWEKKNKDLRQRKGRPGKKASSLQPGSPPAEGRL